MNNYDQAVAELRTAKDVKQWNTIRAKWVAQLTQTELNKIDSSGLITEVLGQDTPASY